MALSKVFLAVLAAIGLSEAGLLDGPANFRLSGITGRWYEIARTSNIPGQTSGDSDVQVYLKLNADGTLTMQQLNYRAQEGFRLTTGKAWAPNSQQPSKLLLQDTPSGVSMAYNILSTDYVGHVCVYSVDASNNPTYGWVLSRTPSLSSQSVNYGLGLFQQIGVNSGLFQYTPQTLATQQSLFGFY